MTYSHFAPVAPEDVVLVRLLERRAAEDPEAVFFTFGEEVHTRGAFNARVNRVARNLLEQGIGEGSHVAVLMDNSPDYLALWFALILIPISLSLALVAEGWRGSRSIRSGGRRVGKVVALWSTIEVVALLVAANAVQYLDRGDLLFPAAAIIVGLHFFPLARGIPVRLYYATGAGFLAAGLGGLLVPAAQRPMAVGASAALVLWATALVVVLRVRSPAQA